MRNEKGYAVLVMMSFLTVVSIFIATMFSRLNTSAETTGLTYAKKRSSYLAEGVTRIVQRFAHDYLSETSTPSSSGLQSYVIAKMTGLQLDRGVLDSLSIQFTGAPVVAPIPTGPFMGMDSYQAPIQTTVKVVSDYSSVSAQAVENSVLGKVGMFQFSLFSDLPSGNSYLVPGLTTTWKGRIHVNGNFCIGNFGSTASDLRVQKVTASGWVRNVRESACWSSGVASANTTYISTDTAFSAFSLFKSGAGSGCTNCDGTGLDWIPYSDSVWRGNLLDASFEIPKLKLPLILSAPTQFGAMPDGTAVDNATSMRSLVDPILTSDLAGVRQQKFAYKADIRIINGVWYLKNPSNPEDWPGVPIWSDHPGRFRTTNEEGIEGTLDVGQFDIRQRWAGTPNQWTVGSTPRNFSYYEYNTTTQRIDPDTTGVISYGTLFSVGGTPERWHPGQYVQNNSDTLCQPTLNCTNCVTDSVADALVAGSVTCAAGVQPEVPDFILNGTRSGFVDGNVYTTSPTPVSDQQQRAKVFPTNFDVSAFRVALANTGAGELGSYFGTGRFMNREFNGIVYITHTWQGSLNGYGAGFANEYPFQGAQSDAAQAALSHPTQQRALPFPLCSSNSVSFPGGLSGQTFAGAQGHFVVPDCYKYDPSYIAIDRIDSRPNAIRIINGDTIDPVVFPKGLTIASNLPAYVLGEYNVGSDVTSKTATPWIPALIVADQVTLLSKNWNDQNSRWDVAPSSFPRLALNTRYHVSFLTGGTTTTPTVWGAGLENLPRFIEKWNYSGIQKTATVRGSMVMGFYSAYFRNRVGPSVPTSTWGPITYLPPIRDYDFDEHLESYFNQPPGAPVFDIYALKSWQRF